MPGAESLDARARSVVHGTPRDASTELLDIGGAAPVQFRLVPCTDGIPPGASLPQDDVVLLHRAQHPDPFAILGAHAIHVAEHGNSSEALIVVIIRFWKKDVREASIRLIGTASRGPASPAVDNAGFRTSWMPMRRRADWLYEAAFTVVGEEPLCRRAVEVAMQGVLYEVTVRYEGDPSEAEHLVHDVYRYGLLLPSYDLKLFQSGSCWSVDDLMGSHVTEVDGTCGVRFAVWAPNARFVSVVGDWNQWDGRAHPMRKRVEFGVWELFVPDIGPGEKYGYRIQARSGVDFVKIDPYAQEFEVPPATASIVSACDDVYKRQCGQEPFTWTDDAWMQEQRALAKRGELGRQPISIYEVHLPSWMRGEGNTYLSYRELAHRLVQHVKALHFTHVEFLPVMHHPFEGSWGYQVSGFYAPYSRLGTPDDLKYLINELHMHGIGVLIDIVLAHFVKDAWGLVYYDGEPCYESADPREGEHEGWGTMIFNFSRNEVRSFLLGAAYHWIRRYHVDGLRVDAVSTIISRSHGRQPGRWIPNEFGGEENIHGIRFLQELDWVTHREFPGVLTMAEESTAWKGVTQTQDAGGLGFDMKWDLGWMNDTLSYLCTPAQLRWEKHTKLTFRGLYMGHEKWILPLSHDEVVSGKGSLVDKCGFSGTPFLERLRTLKALYGFQVGMPGRPLLFMGGEFGQGREWKETRSVDWHEALEPARKGVLAFVADVYGLYCAEPALHFGDDDVRTFLWVDCENAKDNIVAWLRKHDIWSNDILVACNFSGVNYPKYPLGVPHGGPWLTLINSDDWKYCGDMYGPGKGVEIPTTVGGRLGWPYCLWIDLPAFSCVMLKAPKAEPSATVELLLLEAGKETDPLEQQPP